MAAMALIEIEAHLLGLPTKMGGFFHGYVK